MSSKRVIAVFSVVLWLLLLTAIAPAVAQEPSTGERVAALGAPATVLVIGEYRAIFAYPYANYTIDRQGNFHFEIHPEVKGFSQNVDESWSGSGFIITPDGYIITNAHVATDTLTKEVYISDLVDRDLTVRLQNHDFPQQLADNFSESRYLFYQTYGKFSREVTSISVILRTAATTPTDAFSSKSVQADVRMAGDVVGEGTSMDAAVIKINAGFPLPTVALGDSDTVDVGQAVYVIGYPGIVTYTAPSAELEPTVTAGIAGALKSVTGAQWKAIQTDATIHHGNSGGPAFNADGNVIGIATFGAEEPTPGGGSTELSGINFLVPINVAKPFLSEIGIQPSRGELDKYWEDALGLFWANHYSAAIEQFDKVKEAYPNHLYLDQYTGQATAAIGAGKDIPVPEAKNIPPYPTIFGIDIRWFGAGIVSILAVSTIVFAISRKAVRPSSHDERIAPHSRPPASTSSGQVSAEYCIHCGARITEKN